ncbi:phosphoenolpyruvate synthase [Saccharicrinis fermentans DSM 9555 = JCM 21142]|uniref:Phosphoenolpyruvate synthase n=1 Tax=Saccharicrinis fermentans DSM 9555 = JCM 21142 TaxID=869213 RepID=W7Y6Q4_9BACT|nr:phosphoenolpyruvate synthase [Saccharicrinis fermentans DSM 9555 = JCM 21142]
MDIYRNLDYQAIGKYKSCGILNKLSRKYDFKVPECAFVIPFHYYHQHVISSSTSSLIDSLLSVKNTIPKDSLQLLLTEIRTRIKRAPIDTILMKEVNSKVSTDCVYSRFRFRSSTNAEDAKGFSGAGLYTSKTGVRNSEKKSFEKVIKKIWASLWTYEAFSERAYYHIDHKDVYMGIPVHRSFPNEEVNGVAITKNIYIKQVRLYND